MALEKAVIINMQTHARISVMFNPEEYSLDLGNNFAEIDIPGLKTPPIQYVRGNLRTLNMELFFDTYEKEVNGKKVDVRVETRPLTALLDKDPTTQAPPVLLFTWGGLNFDCVLESVAQRFILFGQDGTPLRARLTVVFKEFQAAAITIQQGFFFGPPTVHNVVVPAAQRAVAEARTVYGEARRVYEEARSAIEPVVRKVVEGESLSKIAGELLGDPGAWRKIADLNNIDNPLKLEPGLSLLIPRLPHGGSR